MDAALGPRPMPYDMIVDSQEGSESIVGTLDAKQSLMAVAAGMASAFALLSLVSGSLLAMPLFYLAPLPLYLTGLAWGAKAAGIAALGGTLAIGVAGGLLVATPYAVVMAAPAWLVCRHALRSRSNANATTVDDWYPVGDLLARMTLMALTLFVVAALSIGGEGGGLYASVDAALRSGFEQMAPHLDPATISRSVDAMVPLFPGMLGANWLLMTAVNAAIAQGVLKRSGRNLRPSPAYGSLALPQWAAWPLLAAALMALVGSGDIEYLGRNMALVAATPFFLLGLVVVHRIIGGIQGRGAMLIAFYMILLISGWASLVVAGVGLLELWVGLRQRFGGAAQHPNDEESE